MEKQNKPILDVCCGSRMFWFDKQNPLALFTDIRDFEDTLCDGRKISVKPDKIEDCTNLSFADNTFKLVVFDPPHLVRAGENSWLAKNTGNFPKTGKALLMTPYMNVCECWMITVYLSSSGIRTR